MYIHMYVYFKKTWIKHLAMSLRKSSTLIVLARDQALRHDKQIDFRALLFKRHDKASFMPNSSVFPGGVCEAADESPLWRNHFEKLGVTKDLLRPLTLSKGNVSTIFTNDNREVLERQLSLRITAIRETFEELGIILCRDRKSFDMLNEGYGNFKEDFDRKHWQKLVHNDANKFLTLCEELNVVPDLWNLYEWSNWVTPSTFEKRFDTAFFIVALEKVPNVLPESHEVKDFAWKTPSDYLNAYYNKEIWLPPPQIYELSRLLNFNKIEDIINFAKDRCLEGSIATLPVQYKLNNGLVSLLHGDDMYPADPNASDTPIEVNKEIKTFRENVKNLHRIEYYNSHYAVVRQNFKPLCGHIKPVMTSSNETD